MDTLALFFFFIQQLGVTLGVGASTFAVMFYVLGGADGRIDQSERAFMHAVFVTLRIGLFLIIMSGLAITAAHYLAGDVALILTPTYLFKWVLIMIIVVNSLLLHWRVVPLFAGGSVAGASWYAVFVIHTLALKLSWGFLIGVYLVWLVLFTLLFSMLARVAKRLHEEEVRRALPSLTPGGARKPIVPIPAQKPR